MIMDVCVCNTQVYFSTPIFVLLMTSIQVIYTLCNYGMTNGGWLTRHVTNHCEWSGKPQTFVIENKQLLDKNKLVFIDHPHRYVCNA